ncbi:ComF family protein [Allorhodopirellula solitaria]|uniref:DNA utilization protein GntX n=1 Tax=Allorhodopirellula solitaria TaxID=2527987 RepID=A0A5C5XVN2_9BACT|nr:ComF family protein [Allorhodopirellula solitaria]TWT66463.1 DNA utilization protein GntX [Allorhodopirellula solitaria]
MSAPASAPTQRKVPKPWFFGGFTPRIWESLAPLVFPPVCVLCGDTTRWIANGNSARRYATFCRVCETSLIESQPMMRTACQQCGWPRVVRTPRGGVRGPAGERLSLAAGELGLAAGEQPSEWSPADSQTDSWPCPRCQTRDSPHRFSRITPLYRYHDAARDAVVAAKYPCNSAVARELAMRLADRCRSRWPDLVDSPLPEPPTQPLARQSAGPASSRPAGPPPIVTSVPSPAMRQIRRGGSGTRLLAQYTAKCLGLPYVNLLRTTRGVEKQALLDDDARRDNVRGAFEIVRRWRKRDLDREVLLVDDVMTTGATADEVAGVLIDAGARGVSLAVVALAMRDE